MNRDVTLQHQIEALGPWFHNLHFPSGESTAPDHPLGDFPAFKWRQIAPEVPEDLLGWTALDIGCNAGFYSFELARRGAIVTGIDVDSRYLEQARWAAGVFGFADRIKFRRMQVYDLVRSAEDYDLVLFMGVFYHLRYPLLALDIVRRAVKRLLVFQTLTLPGEEASPVVADPAGDLSGLDRRDALLHPAWPRMAFIEHSFAGDPTNWWVPGRTGVEAMLRSAGFKIVAKPESEIWCCEPVRVPDATGTAEAEFGAATGEAEE